MTGSRVAWSVFTKELLDALRDRRTLLIVLLSSVVLGPLALLLISSLVAGLEQRAEARKLVVQGIEHAPTLRNYLERQTYVIEAPPADFERLLRDSKLGEPVLVVPEGFEEGLRTADPPMLEVVSSSGNQRAQAGVGRVQRLLQGFAQEQAALRLGSRGVASALLEPIVVDERDVATRASRAAQLAVIVPFCVLMAVLYGAMGAALDTTAGERERGSLEPLLMNPATPVQLTLGKWAAVASVAMLIAALSCLSFIPAQWLVKSESVSAMFQYGLGEAGRFLTILLPLAGALAALLMAVAIRCKSFKEAQANAAVVLFAVSLTPLFSMFSQSGEEPWHLWVPALGQTVLMARVLRGEASPVGDPLTALVVCLVLCLLCLVYVASSLRSAALK
ncbi:MAG: ABC transporter permease subunit [Rubrivivax sp.]|jgi:sodium transport system permease protein|nr:ABC transporter permease subunit [Rubrivivax sp.]